MWLVSAIAWKPEHFIYRGAFVSVSKIYSGGFSLGCFLFVYPGAKTYDSNMLPHEWGHSIQNIILGPLDLIVIELVSAIRFWVRKMMKIDDYNGYQRFYTEAWANILGGVDQEQFEKK